MHLSDYLKTSRLKTIKMERKFSSESLESGNDQNTKDIVFSTIKIEPELWKSETLTSAVLSEVDRMCETSGKYLG